MWSPRSSLLPLLGACLLFPEASTLAQGAEPCLKPLQLPFYSGPVEQVRTPGKGDPGLFSTSDGRLCEIFPVPGGASAAPQAIEERTPTPGRAFLLSALFPGVGQRTLGQDRWIAYMAGEVWAWTQYVGRRRDGRRLQERYRDLAWLVARRVSSGPRVDGNFEYYESMTQYQASGAFDVDPGRPGVQPEKNPETFNGSIWLLAREIYFLDDPDFPANEGSDQYEKALRYYTGRAIAPSFAWNWSTNTLQQAEFADLIRESDENLRRGTTMIGIILANHLLSAVDALVTGRLLQGEMAEPVMDVTLLPSPFLQDAIALTVRVPTR
jgi:hypothetical protein